MLQDQRHKDWPFQYDMGHYDEETFFFFSLRLVTAGHQPLTSAFVYSSTAIVTTNEIS